MMIKVYTAKSMTGRTGEELVLESAHIARIMSYRGIEVLDPVTVENVSKDQGVLANTGDKLFGYWTRDKRMIREAHVVLDVTGPAKSEGVAHEIGYARYFLFKPVVRIYPKGTEGRISVAKYEDDLIVSTVAEAADAIVELWGTRRKRLLWKIKLLLRCLPNYLKHRATYLIDWI
jgi:hypothetical protein